ncbi:MAG: hypothetical protein IPP71_04900 [Bacteroidetes bacterium]|nr:hypothetical protein [Bacteroidota bacterium]
MKNVFQWIKPGVVMEVGNTEAMSETDLKNSFEALILMARKSGCSKLIVQPRKNTITDKYLSSLYKSVDGYKPAFQILKSGLNFSELQLNYCDFDTF